jgi:8-oxo-dGTP pyrophosphatase MutT (NUDIX family)
MMRIYFNDKAINITADLRTAKAANDLIIENATEQNIPEAIEMIHSAPSVSLVTADPIRLFNSFKKSFTIIKAGGGMVYDKDKLLFIFRKGKWDLPKGKLDEGESLDVCALREVEEETGLNELQLEELLHVSYHTYSEKDKNILKETHWYLMKGNSEAALSPQKAEGIDECTWSRIADKENYLGNSYALVREVVAKGIETILPEL